jgi:DNA primase
MKIDFLKLLPNSFLNSKGDHVVSDCIFCNEARHFYLNRIKIFKKNELGTYKNAWDCKKCGRVGNLKKLLKKLNKEFLLEGESLETKTLSNKLVLFQQEKQKALTEEDLYVPEKSLPKGFQRLKKDNYLKSRGFTQKDFEKYLIGETERERKLKNYIIIVIKEDNEVKGYIARSRLSKEEIKTINYNYKTKGLKKRYLRWKNSDETDFSKLIGGIEEILFGTEIVILVEGVFDKKAVDRALQLDYDLKMKCCFMFGKNISLYQIEKLKRKGIKNIIIAFDPDAINTIKKHAILLKKEFTNVWCVSVAEKDWGDSTDKEIKAAFNNLKSVNEYLCGTVEKKKLI